MITNNSPCLQSVVNAHFGLQESPFSIAPDPRFLFMSHQHQEAWAHIRVGLQGEGGIILLTGEVGTGKTTICRHFLASLRQQDETERPIDLAYILHPALSVNELLHTLCEELTIATAAACSVKTYMDALNHHLLESHAKGRNTVVMIDEAQNLSAEVLEQLRLLTNLETSERKLLQILLVGQPELRELLQRHELRQLNQRITARCHLEAMTQVETRACIDHRLRIAGCDKPLFTAAALRGVYRRSGGIPRLINLICARALLGAYAHAKTGIGSAVIQQAAKEIFGSSSPPPANEQPVYGWLLLPALLLLGWLAYSEYGIRPMPKEQQVTTVVKSPVQQVSMVVPPTVKTETAMFYGGSPARALQTLVQVWQPHAQADDCTEIARSSGLQCFHQALTLAQLRQFDRPAMITMMGDDGYAHAAVVRYLSGDSAQLQWQDHQWSMGLKALEQRRFADVTLLWQATTDYHGPIRRNDTGNIIKRIHQQLDTREGVTLVGGTHPLRWDTAIQTRLKTFQRQQGLKPDGVAGALTLMHLNDAVTIPRPHLQLLSK
ncbi:MAG: AAA family ATPase [Mariprofundaceae bacterium]|nr:AAA family ATPase [Mariprofundaceae bacterium]